MRHGRVALMSMLLALALGACGASTSPPVRYTQESTEAHMLRYFGGQLINEHCNGQRTGASFHFATTAGITFKQPCGLMAVDLARDPSALCTPGDDACAQRVTAMFYARLAERYKVNMGWLANHCRGYPADCQSFAKVEDLCLRAHNRDVITAWDVAKYQSAAHSSAEQKPSLADSVIRAALLR